MAKGLLMVGAGVWMLAGMVALAYGESRVGIRDTYLGGLDADSVWAAAKDVTTPFLEVAVSRDLSCPGLFEEKGQSKPYRIDTSENRQKVLDAAKKNGCQIIAFCTVVPFAKDQDDAANAAWIEKVAQAAAEMKVPVIMMPLGAKELDQEEFLKRGTAFIKAVAPFARATRVQLTVENLGPYLNKEEVLKPLMQAAPNDQVGLALDIANMYWYGYPPARIDELVKTFAPHVRYVHVKNIKYPPAEREKQRSMGWEYGKYAEPVRTGDLDWGKILRAYSDAGFKGDVVIEDDSLGKFDVAGKKKTLKDDASLLRELISRRTKPVSTQSQPAAGAGQPDRPLEPAASEAKPAGPPLVEFETSLGKFTIELAADKTPITVENFLRYVDDGYYEGTIFHRIIAHFMIQGGGFVTVNKQKMEGLHAPIQNEAKQSLKNETGTIAMARTGDPHSATSQFFINVADNAPLDYPGSDGWGYCAFGRVVDGRDIVDKIRTVETRGNPMMPRDGKSVPVNPPTILKVRRVR